MEKESVFKSKHNRDEIIARRLELQTQEAAKAKTQEEAKQIITGISNVLEGEVLAGISHDEA